MDEKVMRMLPASMMHGNCPRCDLKTFIDIKEDALDLFCSDQQVDELISVVPWILESEDGEPCGLFVIKLYEGKPLTPE